MIVIALTIDAVLSQRDVAPFGGGAIFLPFICFFIHRVMVSLKYASLSKSEYKRFMNAPKSIANTYMAQVQLITGLLGEDDDVLHFEIASVATRLGFVLSDLNFEISKALDVRHKQRESWECLISLNDNTTQKDEEVGPMNDANVNVFTVPVEIVCYSVLKKGGHNYEEDTKLFFWFNIVVTVTAVIAPMVCSPSAAALDIVFFLCSTFLVAMFFGIILNFFRTALFFFYRLHVVADMLGAMLSPKLDFSLNYGQITQSAQLHLTGQEDQLSALELSPLQANTSVKSTAQTALIASRPSMRRRYLMGGGMVGAPLQPLQSHESGDSAVSPFFHTASAL